jgi:hypothetical protein
LADFLNFFATITFVLVNRHLIFSFLDQHENYFLKSMTN